MQVCAGKQPIAASITVPDRDAIAAFPPLAIWPHAPRRLGSSSLHLRAAKRLTQSHRQETASAPFGGSCSLNSTSPRTDATMLCVLVATADPEEAESRHSRSALPAAFVFGRLPPITQLASTVPLITSPGPVNLNCPARIFLRLPIDFNISCHLRPVPQSYFPPVETDSIQ